MKFSGGDFESFIWKKKGGAGNTEKIIGRLTEYIFCFFVRKQKGVFNFKKIERDYKFRDAVGPYNLEGIEKTNSGMYARPTMGFPIIDPETNQKFFPSEGKRWTIGADFVKNAIENKKLFFDYEKNRVYRIKRPEDYEESENVFYNLLTDCGSMSTAKDEIEDLLGIRELFDTPKPTKLLHTLLEIASTPDSLVLDFFSGSGTTAHAVMQLNAEDGGNRKFIMVQLPEKCVPESEAARAGYANICEIGKERIRRAGTKIRESLGLAGTALDVGFRVLKVDSGSRADVLRVPEETKREELLNFQSNLKADRSALDLLFACILDWGLELTGTLRRERICERDVYFYGNAGAEIAACFDAHVGDELLTEIAKRKPARAVFRDDGFVTSAAKINAIEIFKHYAPEADVKVI